MDDYKVSDRAYLERCRDRLLQNSKSGLFYAAFELKCFVEGKLAEYVEHWEGNKGKRVQPFKIGENARTIQKIRSGETIAKMVFTSELNPSGRHTYYHTPVSDRLKRYAERTLDELRHVQSIYRAPEDDWWDKTRTGMIEAYRLAWVTAKGTSPVPPLYDWTNNSQQFHPFVFFYPDGDGEGGPPLPMKAGATFSMEVSYLDEPPAHWVCDI